ncbi:DEAD-domain-containing protein [Pluteus cervinus]|uniref:DEAD-domain-containing protein n=1 Tax=Pluteus cervinus TaxID=181527 RepID=A0ACD3BCR4_9AGAR|nr:DEAD-domain-containing protein [Pluteus cervinus]
MPPQKRKRDDESDDESDIEQYEFNTDGSGDELDISSALAGKSLHTDKDIEISDDDEALSAFIQSSISKRDKKKGTEVMKKGKGKTKLAKGEVGGGSFQSMGLNPSLLRSLTLQGFRIPTPIQRLAIPALLANPPKDLVGMARTGSGKSLAFIVPLVQRLGGRHSTAFGARALILLPTRELALQLLKVGKELARGWQTEGEHAGDRKGKGRKDPTDDNPARRGQNLRWGLVVGGEGLDEQFEMITNNPDIIIATPGRLLHLIVEMNLDLKSVQYAVFDEADRLFEMGFETALNEILQRLPATRQTLLFSATLPKSLVEFAKAGLQNPKLVRLDAESKISSDLKMAFFSVKEAEKDACLLSLLRDVINVPLKDTQQERPTESSKKSKRKRPEHSTSPHQTLVFAATKHHVEYLTILLTTAGYAVSHIYGSLDQAARTFQMDQFRQGVTSILVVTDVAARGIDIPVLENVINYDFPQGARVFVHRVGRTARAGRQGWAWSFITNGELPHLLDLQLFLGRPLRSRIDENDNDDRAYIDTLVLGSFEREKVDEDVEYVRSLDEINHSLPTLREVMRRGHAMYERSKGKASPVSYKRAKEMTKDTTGQWQLAGVNPGVHPVLLRGVKGAVELESKKQSLLKSVNAFRPAETVFEISTKGKTNAETASLMKDRRKALEKSRSRAADTSGVDANVVHVGLSRQEMADEEDIAAVFDTSGKGHSYRDEEFYISYHQKDAITEKGYSLTDGASFIEQARGATFDLVGDDAVAERKKRQLNWDKKKKKFIKGDGVGADNVKLVKTESGTRLPATYRSGRFDEWKAKTRVSLPKLGEAENQKMPGRKPIGADGRRFKHSKLIDAKPLDKLRNDYDRKARQGKKADERRVKDGAGGSETDTKQQHNKGSKFGGRNAGKSVGRVKSELRTADQIRKNRRVMEKRRAKNSRPSKKGRR